MIFINMYDRDTIMALFGNIEKYDMIYAVHPDKKNGEMQQVDEHTIYYLNPNQEIQFEIAMELLLNEINNGDISNVALVNTHYLQIQTIRYFNDLPINVDFYGKWSDRYMNVYASSKYLHNQQVKEEQNDSKE